MTVLTEWARLFIGALVRSGVSDFVVSPGSRSTPLVVALAQRDDVEITSAIDERTGAFFALGRARLTDRPTALVCTSGTAAAHYYPAVIEAAASGLSLVVVTADRPNELMGLGAPQTIDQRGLFGRHVRAEIELGMPDAHAAALDGLVRAAVRGVAASRWPTRGPVHFNFRARKPLEAPLAGDDALEPDSDLEVSRRLAEVPIVQVPDARVRSNVLDTVLDRLASARRPLILAGRFRGGPEVAAEVYSLAETIGAPIAADVTSGLRRRQSIDAADAFVGDAPIELLPDLVLRLGEGPTVSSWTAFFGRCRSAETIVLHDDGLSDPTLDGDLFVLGDVRDAIVRLAEHATVGAAEHDWRGRWETYNRGARVAVDAAPWGEGRAAAAVVEALPEHGIVIAGNSLAVRHLDLFAPATNHRVLCQRGVSGIDGLISGAAGTASATDSPVALVLGDVSFVHDVGGLLLARAIRTPLAIVVLDNNGGRIFEQLPVATVHPEAMAHFITPTDVRFDAAAAAFGVPYVRADGPSDFSSAVTAALRGTGATVVHAVFAPSDAATVLRKIRQEARA